MIVIYSSISVIAVILLIIVARMKIKLIKNPMINRSTNMINLYIYRMIVLSLATHGCLLVSNVCFMFIVKLKAPLGEEELVPNFIAYGGVGLLTFLS